MIHKLAIVDDNVDIGKGTNIWAFSHICSGVRIGENCSIGEGVHIGTNVIIGDNCKIQNHSLIYEGVTLGPNTITTNDLYPKAQGEWTRDNFRRTLFKKGCSIGANSTIICGVTIGENSLVGAGSVVTKNTPNNSKSFGNPATIK